MKPFSAASEKNQEPILAILQTILTHPAEILEIGSGTGQHAVFFAAALPHLTWQTSDLVENHAGIQAWIADSGLSNVLSPLHLDVNAEIWPVQATDAIFTANTFHIMSWQTVQNAIKGIGKVLKPSGVFCVYGPFNYHGNYTSESNAAFDTYLKQVNPHQSIRDFEAIQQHAAQNGMHLLKDYEMPANNRLLVWKKQ